MESAPYVTEQVDGLAKEGEDCSNVEGRREDSYDFEEEDGGMGDWLKIEFSKETREEEE